MKHFAVTIAVSLLAFGSIVAPGSVRAQSANNSDAVSNNAGLGTKSYQVISVQPNEIIVRIAPQYQSQLVTDASSNKTYTKITFGGGTALDSAGSPEIPRLVLPFIAPSRMPPEIEIVSQTLDVLPNIELAPVPTYTKKHGEYQAQYLMRTDRYDAPATTPLFSAQPTGLFRMAYAGRILVSPIEYDASSHTVTRVRELTLRIRFNTTSVPPNNTTAVAPNEATLFRSIFINGALSQFYTAAEQEVTRYNRPARTASGKNDVATSLAGNDGQWLQIETTDEGVYRITAQDLAKAGITGTIDTSAIELFGIGGELLGETVTGSNGEWIERPIDIRADGGNFTEFYFYAPGVTVWKYSSSGSNVDGLYHTLNPYTSTGHFLLKIGGDRLGNDLRVPFAADTLTAAAVPGNRVFTAVTHELERTLEYPNVGREMLGEDIRRADVGPLTIAIPVPGYTPDSTTIRVGYDSKINDPDAGSVSVQVNGQLAGSIDARTMSSTDVQDGLPWKRNWDNALSVSPSVSQGPLNVSLAFTSSGVTTLASLDFIELMYRRSTDIGSLSIPFMVLNTKQAFQYTFTSAGNAEVWDVTHSSSPRIIAQVSGDAMVANIQGVPSILRRFIAFTPQSALSPSITPMSAPALRNTICQQGAEEIIVTPSAFLAQANELKQLRQQGGQATDPLSVAVVTTDDIYREFGYGSNDLTAIRDFMAYTFRHAATKPHYLALFGDGHCDYQNRATNIPDWMPPYEFPDNEYLGSYRTNVNIATPDDGFFGRLDESHANDQKIMDVAVGRIAVENVDTAEAFVQKVKHYELSSDPGSWRSLATFVADDRIADPPTIHDALDHLGDTKTEISKMPERILLNDIFEVSYPTVYTSTGGRQKPAVNQAIIDAMNNGSVLLSFVGHGNPEVWTHEGVLSVPSTILHFNNFDRLAYVTAATCDFSQFDDYSVSSGGVDFLTKPDGGAIGLLGTTRSVTGSEELVFQFYQTLFDIDPQSGEGTASVGDAMLAGKIACVSGNLPFYYLLGDPAQHLLVPRLYVNFDSINGKPVANTDGRLPLPALSQMQISGRIAQGTDSTTPTMQNYDGSVTITLYDTPTLETATTTFSDDSPIHDSYYVDGPILYRGTATVTNGRFTISFVIPRDVKSDTAAAKLSGYAFSNDNRSALGDTHNIQLFAAPDSILAVRDTSKPAIAVYLGNRMFRSGDAVSKHSTVIVDVSAFHGLNTSTASIGHSFVAWVDDAEDSAIDLASTYVSKQDDYHSGTSEHAIELPAGHHTLHVRAFDTFDNPTFASVDFVAKNEDPYQLYDVLTVPNPLSDHTIFSFVQPGHAGSLVHAALSIYTTDGRLVRTLSADSRESTVEIPWDGRDDRSTRVANGVYVFIVNAQNIDDGTSSQAQGKCVVAY
ncbi:MAG TPA: type IX secretion system sortase PorU [Candidatus Kapabacteria bacterium]|nr:type IX secretion system sortase PorU [Candidatus Kapabacteria bacterium]